ncbi:DUF6776 family protein [Dokdonella koreensis]|uniref:Transmembrane protein n=1 Tax=Dokdonella koreensis DS-123 TaxID=1300342 RepID=A0A167H7J1_9GAMM|nr:DUF6776 family protein [Dokdonella koreensis]ANB19316.1 Hypothetical protein I596_3327 [Dokdonella koreensis DS-123]
MRRRPAMPVGEDVGIAGPGVILADPSFVVTPMIRQPPSLVIRALDRNRERRRWVLLGAAWLASLLLAGYLGAQLASGRDGARSALSLEQVRGENEDLKARAAVLQRSEQVAKVAMEDLRRSLGERDEEIASLRADLAFYGRLVGGTRREGLAVHDLRLTPVDGSRAWNFVATLTQNIKRGQDIRGRLTLSVEGVRDGKLVTLDWKSLVDSGSASGIEYGFKYFEQVKGTIMLPEGFAPNRLHLQADGSGNRAEQDFQWADAVKSQETTDVG